MESQVSQNKLAARQCLLAADKYIKDSQFSEAKREIEKAKSLDPSNLYISAFIDRISYFEKEKNSVAKSAKPIPTPKVPPAQSIPVVQKPTQQNVITPPAPKQTVAAKVQPAQPRPAQNVTQPAPPKPAEPVSPRAKTPQPEQTLPQEKVEIKYSAEPVKVTPKVTIAEQEQVDGNPSAPVSVNIRDDKNEPSITASQLEDMKRKIDLLSKALEEEKKSREEMNQQQMKQAITKYRTALEKAWVEGAPAEQKANELEQLATTLAIPENVLRTIQREVKIEMYGRAVKEVIAKRQLLRSSSSTLEWLRKVYKISLEEYLEYESKFLMDLVADQYKGTILQISSDEGTKKEVTPRLKAMGYAVVTSPTPEDALEKIDKLNPNVIICETNFGPGTISGIRFLHILRTNSKFNFIPYIFLSSEEDFSLLTSSELRPNEGFVQKPINFDDLSALINKKLLWFREYIMSLSK